MAQTSKSQSGRPRGGLLWRVFKLTVTVGVWAAIAVAGLLVWYATDLPDIDDALAATRRPTVTLLAADGSVIATRGDLYGIPLDLGSLPKSLPQAVLATEDRRFYNHFGIDLIGITRAAWNNIRAGRIVQGGSTITQQAAKNLFLTPERSLKRKLQELMLALWLERKFSKDQILTIYLNRVYLGAGTYGVDAAARRYFGRSATRVSVYQAAMLAGLLKAPSRYNPRADRRRAERRTDQVFVNMIAAGYLSEAEAKAAKRQKGVRDPADQTIAGYFIDWVLEQISDYIAPGNNDVSVTTTLNPILQRAAERRTTAMLSGSGAKLGVGQAALVALATDGAVRAMVGGRDHAKSEFNRAVQARRQPGSAFKPFIFLAALEAGYRPERRISDAPITIGDWKPRNFDNQHRGEISLTEALARSVNTAAVRLAEEIGRGKVAEVAARFGLGGEIKPTPSLALGTHEVSLLELTAAYGPFANGGSGVWPYGITEIRNGAGDLLYRRQGSGPGRTADPHDIAAMNRMLAQVVVGGTGKAAGMPRPVAGKTGTSQNHRDAWFIGYSADLVTGVWMGNDDGAPMTRVTGGGLPARLWKSFMTDAHLGLAKRRLPGGGVPMATATASGGDIKKTKPPTAKTEESTGLWDRIRSVFGADN